MINKKATKLKPIGLGLLAATFGASLASAMNVPAPIEVNGGPLGPLEVSGGIDGFFYALSGTGDNSLLGNGKSVGANSFNNDVKVIKPDGFVQFTIEVHPADTLHFGKLLTGPSIKSFTLSPIYVAYATLAPTPNLKISAGQVYSVEGLESSVDWYNANIVESPLYAVGNSSSRGVEATYLHGPFAATLVFGDGFDSGVFNTFQGRIVDKFDKNNALEFYGETNVGRTGPNTFAYGGGETGYGYKSQAAYVNSTMVGGYYTYTNGNLKLQPEVQYVYAKVDHEIGIDKFSSNFGAMLVSDYQFGKSPWSLGGMAFYYRNNGLYGWYLNPNSASIGLGLTPTWQQGSFFVRAEAAVLHLTQIGNGVAFGNAGTDRNQGTGILEAGIIF